MAIHVILPKLNVYVNEYSRSSTKAFIEIVKLIIPKYNIYGEINTDDLCGTLITIATPFYELNIPTMCYVTQGCNKKKLDLKFDDVI